MTACKRSVRVAHNGNHQGSVMTKPASVRSEPWYLAEVPAEPPRLTRAASVPVTGHGVVERGGGDSFAARLEYS